MSAFRFDGTIQSPTGEALAGIEVFVCTQPATTDVIPPSPLATLFTGTDGLTVSDNPVVTDGNGNYSFYAASGTYTLVYYSPFSGETIGIFPDQLVVSPGGGSVTSVGLSAPAEFSTSGSPVTGSGVLGFDWTNQNANLVWAGPASGPAARPTYRKLVAADFPAGVGTVTSVGASLGVGSLFTGGVAGSPITVSGTLAFTLDFLPQAANKILASPASGGSGAITARSIVAADMFAAPTVSFSATPTFDASLAAIPTFKMTLTGDVTSSTVSNATSGQMINFAITQDSSGAHAFTWPTNFKGASAIDAAANSISIQTFVYDGANWLATGPGLTITP